MGVSLMKKLGLNLNIDFINNKVELTKSELISSEISSTVSVVKQKKEKNK